MTTNKKFYYEIIVWRTNHLAGCGIWSIDEAQNALSQHLEFLADGFKWSFITVTQQNVWGDYVGEYGADMADCMPLECLPKYVQEKIGSIMTMTFGE